MARPSYLNRKFFIKKRFQGKFILLYTLSALGIVSLATYFLYLQIDAAVEKHLYSTHLKIDHVGDFLVSLMFRANFYTISAIVTMVLIFSLIIFKGINRNFKRMETTVEAMSRGDYSIAYIPGRSFTEIGNLAALLEQARTANKSRAERMRVALETLEKGCVSPGDSKLFKDGKEQLDQLLDEIRLP